MSKKVIVTGGAGYIGSHTVVELISYGYEPLIIDDFSNSDYSVISGLKEITGTDIKIVEGKVQAEGLLDKIFEEEGKIDGIIHFAAYKAVGESVDEPLKYYDNNIKSTLSLLQGLAKRKNTKLVFSSSCTVYGQPDVLPVTEESPRKSAESPYGNTKQICEDMIRDTVGSEGLKALSLRYFNPIGAHKSALIGELPIGVPANLVPFVTQTAAGIRDEITIFGNDYNTPDGTCIRDYIHVSDLANAHVKALEYLDGKPEGSIYDVFNIGIGMGVSVLELIQTFEKVNDLTLNYKIGARRSGDIEKIWADSRKVTEQMKWQPTHTLEDALESAWKWQKQQ